MRTIILIMALLASVSLVAQENIDSILFSIEENNSTLKALREETNAQKLGNKTDRDNENNAYTESCSADAV